MCTPVKQTNVKNVKHPAYIDLLITIDIMMILDYTFALLTAVINNIKESLLAVSLLFTGRGRSVVLKSTSKKRGQCSLSGRFGADT